MEERLRKTSIDIVGDVPWGTHFCQFYQTKQDLIEILVPYFKMGLENNEFCVWITSEPLSAKEATEALKKEASNLDDYVRKGQIEILDHSQWYTKPGYFDSEQVLQGWVEKEKEALRNGFDGLRLTGNTLWLEKKDWRDFTEYEAAVNSVIGKFRMLAICTYCLDKCGASEIMDIVSNHQFALIKREGKWEIIESARYKKTVAALQETEHRYKHLFEQSPLGIGLASPDGKVVAANRAMEAVTGYSGEELKELNISDIYDNPEDRQVLTEAVDRGDSVVNLPARLRRKDGAPYDALLTISRVHLGGKDLFQTICTDITERKQREEELQRAKRELTIRNKIAEIFLTVPDEEMFGEVLQVVLGAMESEYGIFGYIDEHGVLVIPSMTRDVWEKCQVPDKTIVYPPEKWAGIWGRALVEKRSLFANEGLHVPEGHVPITKVLVTPVMYGEQVIGLLEVANKSTDYSCKDQEFLETIAGKIAPILNARLQRDRQEKERKQAEEALRRSEERYALAQRAANIGSWDWNILTGELVWSDQIEPIFGFGRGEFGATYQAFLECVHSEDRQHVIDSVNACVEQGKDYAIEHRIVWPDKTVRWVSEIGNVVRDEKGRAIRMLGVVQDITERKDAESRQQLAGQVLECLNREKMDMDVVRDVLALVRESTGFEAIGIRLHRGDDFPYFQTQGFPEDFVKAENYLCARTENGELIYDSQGAALLECMCGNIISGRTDPALPFFTEGGSFWTNSTTQLLSSTPPGDLQARTRNRCNQAGYESVALIPLRSDRQIVGLLQLNDTRPGRFTREVIRFFEDIGASIGIALARMRAEQDLEKYRQHLEELVQARTEELTEANKQLLHEIERRRHLEKEILAISETEQRRIGQELHDSLGQQLTGIAMMSKLLEKRLKGRALTESDDAKEIATLVNQAIDQTRGLAKGLHPVDLHSSGLMSALQMLAATTENVFGVSCIFRCNNAVPVDDPSMALHLYRIAQEAVSNAIKHGKAKNILLELSDGRQTCTLTIRSDGRSFPKVPPQSKGMGLQIMAYRAEMIDASLDICPGDGGGTVLTCVFPNRRTDTE
jgi:PAS domain S-box-containing protein